MACGAWRLISMEQKRPQLNLTELHQLKWLLGGALALLAAWSVLYVDVEAWFWLGAITIAVPVVVRWPLLTLYIPRWIHVLAFPLFVVLFAADYYLAKELMPALIRLALMLVFYRAVTPRRRRDDLLLIVLGLFLVVVSGVLSVSLVFAFQIVAFTACTLINLLVLNVLETAEMGQVEVAPTRQAPPSWMRIDWLLLLRRLREGTDWRLVVVGTGVFGGVVGLSVLLFFALPRFEFSNHVFFDNLISTKSKTGFSDTVGFGDVTDIQQDRSVALSVDVSDPRLIPADCYWRMVVLDDYDAGIFSVSKELKQQLLGQRQPAAQITGGALPQADDVSWVFYLEAGVSNYLPLLGDFHQLQFSDGAQDYAINDTLRVLRLKTTPSKMFAYRVEGMRAGAALGTPAVSPARDLLTLAQPRVNDAQPSDLARNAGPSFLALKLNETDRAQVAAWVREINAPQADAPAFSRQVAAWLTRKHAYSLQMTLPPGTADPLVRWMASNEAGHCELFAGAFTLLARVAGYPARMVTGFHGGSWNTTSKNLTIRNSDAHAWCEIFDEQTQAWLRVDPTAGAVERGTSGEGESPEAVLARISDRSWAAKFDGLRMFWYRRIVDFDQKSQADLARGAKAAIESRGQQLKLEIKRLLKELGTWLQQPWEVGRVVAVTTVLAGCVAVVVAGVYYGPRGWRRWVGERASAVDDPVRREAGYWLRRLTARQPAAEAQLEWVQVRADLERLRYGPPAGRANVRQVFKCAKRACRT